MNLVRLLPVILSCLLLAAHFLRAGFLLLVLICLILPFLLLVRRPWVVRVIQGVLVLGAVEWLRTLLGTVSVRQAAGEPWLRLGLILGAVILVTLASTLVFQLPALAKRYSL